MLQAESKYMSGHHEEAIRDCDEAIKLNPKSNMAWQARGASNRMLKRYKEAIRDCDKAIKLNPKNDRAWKARGASNRMLKRYKEAIRDYDEAIKLNPKSNMAWQERGHSKHALGMFKEAIQDYDENIKVAHYDVDAWLMRGNSKMKLGFYDEAIKDFDQVIKFKPKYAIAWCGRGRTKRALGCHEEALQDFNEALKLDPKNISAKQELEKIQEEMKKAPKPKPQEVAPSIAAATNSPVFNHAINFSMTIPKEQLSFANPLGEGSFGEVHKGIWSPTSLFKVTVAIKRLKNTSMSVKVLEDFKREVEIQAKLDSPGVVKLFGTTAQQPYCMVMEFMERGSLRDILDSQKPGELKWNIKVQMAINMTKGLAYLHSQNPMIIHGDLKSLNILVNGKDEAKLADFGLAALKTETRSKEYVGGNAEKNKGPKGSLLWIAPELFRMNAKRTTASDIFSLGIVFWELASHLFPYESANGNESLIREWVTSGEREAFDERTPNTPKEYISLAQRCWDAKPENRPSAEKVVVQLDALYSKMPLAPTFFSSGLNPEKKSELVSSGYMANTASTPVASKSNSGYLMKSVTPTTTSSQSASQQIPPQQVPPKGAYMGNVYK